jgi:hypothetical protein
MTSIIKQLKMARKVYMKKPLKERDKNIVDELNRRIKAAQEKVPTHCKKIITTYDPDHKHRFTNKEVLIDYENWRYNK